MKALAVFLAYRHGELGRRRRRAAPHGFGLLALCLLTRRNMCVHPRLVAESDRVPEHDRDLATKRVAADPVSVEMCPHLDEGGEDVTLPCGILDLDSGGTGVV